MSVFAVENTDGKDIAIADYTPKTVDINAEKLIRITEKLGCTVSYLPYGGKVLGTYNPLERKIILRSEDYDVLAHEVGHFLHDLTEGINSVDRNTAEIIAELTSAVLCEMNGVHGYERQSFNYIREYSRANDAKAVIKAINKVLATVEKNIAVIIDNQ
jgi:antirestriction protein ArdC